MAETLVTDELWPLTYSLLPSEHPKSKGGRPWVPDQVALDGILSVLKTGIGWAHLTQADGRSMTCWRRLRDWHAAGVFSRLHQLRLDRIAQANQLVWTRAHVDPNEHPRSRPEGCMRTRRMTFSGAAGHATSVASRCGSLTGVGNPVSGWANTDGW